MKYIKHNKISIRNIKKTTKSLKKNNKISIRNVKKTTKSLKKHNLYGGGRIDYPNGDYYDGELHPSNSRIRHGNGSLYDRNGVLLYRGSWVNDKRHNEKPESTSLMQTNFTWFNFKKNRDESITGLLRCKYKNDLFSAKDDVWFPATQVAGAFGYVGRYNAALNIPHHLYSLGAKPAILKLENGEIYHTFFKMGKIDGIAYVTSDTGAIIRVEKWTEGLISRAQIHISDSIVPYYITDLEYRGFMFLFGRQYVMNNAHYIWRRLKDFLKSSYIPVNELSTKVFLGSDPHNRFNLSSDTHRLLEEIIIPQMQELVSLASRIFGIGNDEISINIQSLTRACIDELFERLVLQRQSSTIVGGRFDTIPKSIFEAICILFFTSSANYSTYKLINFIFKNSNMHLITVQEYVSILQNPIIINFIIGLEKCPTVKEILPRYRAHLLSIQPRVYQLTYIYRCIRIPTSTLPTYSMLIAGDIVHFNVFQSFTLALSSTMIRLFGPSRVHPAEPNLLIFRIESTSTSARCISQFSVIPREEEVLILPNIPYEIVSVHTFENDFSRPRLIRDILGNNETQIEDYEYDTLFSSSEVVVIITMRELDVYNTELYTRSTILRGGYNE